jgi:hypothetical protein
MVFQNQFLAVVGATLVALHLSAALVALHLGTTPGRAADRNRPFDSGHPLELINRPVCWSAEEPDPSRHCDFGQRF